MRIFEILLSLIALLALWRLAMRRSPRLMDFSGLLAVIFLVLQLVLEGYRWQMAGIYALVLVLFAQSLPQLIKPAQATLQRLKRPAWRVWLYSLLAGLLVAFFTAPAILFPIPAIPDPSGPYSVGTFTQVLVDESRSEIYSGQEGQPRRFLIQAWYPAGSVAGLERAPWMPGAEQVAPAIAGWLGLPSFMLDHLRYVTVPSYVDAPISTSEPSYPVLLFSHGWGGFRSQSAFLMHELASQGYVVIALEHPYGSVYSVFPDGSVAENNPRALPEGAPDEEYARAAQRLGNQWAEDLSFTLDQLELMNADTGIFAGRLDLKRVGAMGHSTGGGAAVLFCSRDPRCQAGLGLDTWMRPVSDEARQLGLQQPFLFMFSELWPTPTNDQLFNELVAHSPATLRMTILGTDHYDFSDLPMLTPIAAQLELKGPLKAERVTLIISTYTRVFFDQVFKGIPTQLFEGPSFDFPEVILWMSV